MPEQDLHLLEDLLDLWYRPGAVDELGHRRRAVPHVGHDQREQRHRLSQEVGNMLKLELLERSTITRVCTLNYINKGHVIRDN